MLRDAALSHLGANRRVHTHPRRPGRAPADHLTRRLRSLHRQASEGRLRNITSAWWERQETKMSADRRVGPPENCTTQARAADETPLLQLAESRNVLVAIRTYLDLRAQSPAAQNNACAVTAAFSTDMQLAPGPHRCGRLPVRRISANHVSKNALRLA
jgi:hypothetical protein